MHFSGLGAPVTDAQNKTSSLSFWYFCVSSLVQSAFRSRPLPPPLRKYRRREQSRRVAVVERAVPIRRLLLRKKIELLRSILGVQQFDLGVICVSNTYIQQLNRTYRQKNIPTDVLSFPFHENLKGGEMPHPCLQDDYNLGDIFLGVEYICQQCEKNQEDYNNILIVTVAHGMCHLLGYEHSTEADWQQMYEKETQILQELSKLTGISYEPLSKYHF